MTEVTRVPILPIAKGSLTKLWLGVVAAVLLGAGIAWGLANHVLHEGGRPPPDLVPLPGHGPPGDRNRQRHRGNRNCDP